MKRAIAMLSFVFLLTPSFALADDQTTATPAPAAAPAAPAAPAARMRPTQAQRDAMMKAMSQMHQQMKALHDQEQSQILATLTASQRNMLANTIGYLALSTKPDHKAAAAKIDAALSAAQKASILKIASDYRAKSKAMMTAAHDKFLAMMPAEARARMAARPKPAGADGSAGPAKMHKRTGHKRTPDAGRLLLAMGSHHMGPMPGMMPGMRRPGMGMRGPGMMQPPGAPGARMHDGAPGRMRAPAPAPSPTQ